MQISTVITITQDNKKKVIDLLQKLEAVSGISQYELRDLLEQIKNYDKNL